MIHPDIKGIILSTNTPDYLALCADGITYGDMMDNTKSRAHFIKCMGGELITYFSQDVLHGLRKSEGEAPSQPVEDGSDEDDYTS
jgi:hypothetical protein